MEKPFTVLRVSLYHPTLGPAAFTSIPPRLQHDINPLLIGRGQGAHLRLQLPNLSRRHLSLEPYLEAGSTLLAFCLKSLSRKGCVCVNGLKLTYLEQVPLSTVNKISFSNVQMVVHLEKGTSLEAFVCHFHLSPSPLIYRPEAEETDDWESIPQEQPPLGSGEQTPGHVGFLHGPPQTWDSLLQPSPGGGTEI
ncbi:TRAF-interacting protein with FHA domain-containing protein B isoform X2 [Otolemur garnettii]|nr:TRAF-interacting protein with FHA domain-containing protein B isoform X2 [Otolemur garnettii]XP_023370913.1 TRAF-interacting protein with FHA domain-containing protein B isoform X2 [Otolemur garnettii]XP_023370917.1 TRAF-interacting protein with FHA domain-containing protein B isoform X2 [Otolemur garnettii]